MVSGKYKSVPTQPAYTSWPDSTHLIEHPPQPLVICICHMYSIAKGRQHVQILVSKILSVPLCAFG